MELNSVEPAAWNRVGHDAPQLAREVLGVTVTEAPILIGVDDQRDDHVTQRDPAVDLQLLGEQAVKRRFLVLGPRSRDRRTMVTSRVPAIPGSVGCTTEGLIGADRAPGLCIADASVMPRGPTGNTMAICVVIGEQAATTIPVEANSR